MAFTSHGHQIPGTPVEERESDNIARCGGPALCSKCAREAASAVSNGDIQGNSTNVHPVDITMIRRALAAVKSVIDENHEKTDPPIKWDTEHSLYVVWFSKTLQHYKALISTTLPDGRYYEVTYNGDKFETYVDTYVKVNNVCVPDEGRPW
jgi:hypothetical protein